MGRQSGARVAPRQPGAQAGAQAAPSAGRICGNVCDPRAASLAAAPKSGVNAMSTTSKGLCKGAAAPTATIMPGLMAGLLAGALIAASPARAADDGAGSVFDVVKSLLLLNDEEPPVIEYRDRAPLVLPPKSAQGLPAPAARQRRADWPQDPDVQRRAAERADRRAPRTSENNLPPDVSMQELNARRGPGGDRSVPVDDQCRNFHGGNCVWMHPDRLRSLGVKKEAENSAPVGSEPDRNWLTQPPQGYRRVTQAAGKGVATPEARDDGPNIRGFFTNPFKKNTDDE